MEEERAKEGTCGGSTLWKKHRGGRELLTQIGGLDAVFFFERYKRTGQELDKLTAVSYPGDGGQGGDQVNDSSLQ